MTTPHHHTIGDLHFGAQVCTSDGVTVGTLHRLILDSAAGDVDALVVTEDGHFAGQSDNPDVIRVFPDAIVPVHLLVTVTPEVITLRIEASAVRGLRAYIHHQWVAGTAAGEVVRLAAGLAGAPTLPPVELFLNKRADQLEVERGENVMIGHDGDTYGTVRDVLIGEDNQVTGVVVHPHGFFTHDMLLPVRVLGRSDDLALFADVSRDDLVRLATEFGRDDAENARHG